MGKESEKLLENLCAKSFLSLWSHPNPYNDKGLPQRGEGKELCDLLVIFGHDILIFSDKSCVFPSTSDESLDWKRWHKKSISESYQQILGAERWLRKFPHRVFRDPKCTDSLHVYLPQEGELRFHRIAVALGAEERCREYFGGGSGSLPIHGGYPHETNDQDRHIFSIGRDGTTEKFLHVFDEIALNFVLRELDTISDFVAYLNAKEKFFYDCGIIATGEEDLLAHYLLNMVDGRHSFLPKNADHATHPVIAIGEESYPALVNLPQYVESKRVNRRSYLWDSLIEHFVNYWRNNKLAQNVTATDLDNALRIMASTNRVRRRKLSELVETAIFETKEGQVRQLSLADEHDHSLAYAVICVGHFPGVPYDQYRQRRIFAMDLFARSMRYRLPNLRRVLAIGVEPYGSQGSSEDLALITFDAWDEKMANDTKEQMDAFGLGAPAQRFVEYEFPMPK